MIALFTDFGLHGPYTGQMKAVLHQMAPGIPVIDLFADAPVGNAKASAYLLAAYALWFPAGPCSSASLILASVGRGRQFFSKPMTGGMLARGTGSSS
jgi:S-adenosylmethionine hydrolase